jgi:hypothetical protein
MPEDGIKQAILDAVEAGFDDQIAFLGDLVRIPSLRCAEAPAQDFMAEATARAVTASTDGRSIWPTSRTWKATRRPWCLTTTPGMWSPRTGRGSGPAAP